MAKFSAKERMIANLLSSMPGLKKTIKKFYILVNAQIYRKPYTQKSKNGFGPIKLVENDDYSESYFGYYDKNCERNGKLIYHKTTGQSTTKVPNPAAPVDIILKDIKSGESSIIARSFTYNWQQGTRLQWLNDSTIIFNSLHDGKYSAQTYNIESGRSDWFPYPVQEVLPDGRYLSINYARIMRLRPDYGYRNLSIPSDREMRNLEDDGIFILNPDTNEGHLLHSISDITSINPKDVFRNCFHVVNHIMARPDGKGFIFIHRFYEGARRHDRLMYSDFHNLSVIADEDMVSHCCWLNNNLILGYLRCHGEDGFFEIDIQTGISKKNRNMSDLDMGDGHPSVNDKYIAFDTYPDKSRMQHLFLINRENGEPQEIAEMAHPVKFMDECRCDLHPRFSSDGQRLYFDTVMNGKRQLAYIDITNKN